MEKRKEQERKREEEKAAKAARLGDSGEDDVL